jgi:deoxyribose-phosphate aldolase
MKFDQNEIEGLVGIITRDVLAAIEEKESKNVHSANDFCKVEYTDEVCVKTCFDNAGHVISAGAERLSSTPGNIPDGAAMASMIDHTSLKPDATEDQIRQLCREAREFNFASVCINPGFVKLCSELLKGSPVKVCTVIGFPLGATTTEVKCFEAKTAIENGATEIDMVINVGAIKAGKLDVVAYDIREVVLVGHHAGALVKVILETCLLNDEEKILACLLCKEAGADFVKTSTGFSSGGATVEDVALMRRTVGPNVGVKASGGIRTREDVEKMVKAGATRIGASAGVRIISGDTDTSPAKGY